MNKELKGELGGKLLDVVSGLMMTPEKYDAYQLHKAIKVGILGKHKGENSPNLRA